MPSAPILPEFGTLERGRQVSGAKGPVVAKRKGYRLHANGRLYTTGRYGYYVGQVSDPEGLDSAIDNHESEVRYLMAAAVAEFSGL
jgi:hypothetical protein